MSLAGAAPTAIRSPGAPTARRPRARRRPRLARRPRRHRAWSSARPPAAWCAAGPRRPSRSDAASAAWRSRPAPADGGRLERLSHPAARAPGRRDRRRRGRLVRAGACAPRPPTASASTAPSRPDPTGGAATRPRSPRVAQTGAPDGAYVARVSRTGSGSSYVLQESTRVGPLRAGARYSAGIWVKAGSASRPAGRSRSSCASGTAGAAWPTRLGVGRAGHHLEPHHGVGDHPHRPAAAST